MKVVNYFVQVLVTRFSGFAIVSSDSTMYVTLKRSRNGIPSPF